MKIIDQGYLIVTFKDDHIIVQNKEGTSSIASVQTIPITFNGTAGFNVENVLAAVGALIGLGYRPDQIRAGLLSFTPSIDQSPGRMNMFDMGDFTVIIDYSHNIGALKATGDFIKAGLTGKLIRMASGVGSRKTDDIREFGVVLSKYSDYVVVCDPDPRTRQVGETAQIIKQGLLKGGMPEDRITLITDEKEATSVTLNKAEPGDLVVLQADNIPEVIKSVLAFKNKLRLN